MIRSTGEGEEILKYLSKDDSQNVFDGKICTASNGNYFEKANQNSDDGYFVIKKKRSFFTWTALIKCVLLQALIKFHYKQWE